MRIGLDTSPLNGGKFLQHRVRGTGFYTKNLKETLLEYYPDNEYIFFSQQKKLSTTVDVVHYPYFEPFFLSLPFRNIFPSIVTVHDLTPLVFPKYFPSGIKGKLKWILQRNRLKGMDAIISDSEQSKKDIIIHTNIDSRKIHVVYLSAGSTFVRISNVKQEIRKIKKKYNLPEKFALYVGDITWNKNLPNLVRAMQKTNIPLAMVGKALVEEDFDATNPWNQDRRIVQEIIRNDKNIIRLGFVEDDDLVRLYNIATAFVMPSLYEGFGLPILEAMKCGCPVITSRLGSIGEVAGDAAYYIDPYSIESISHGVVEVFRSTNLQKILSEKGLKNSKKFTWKQTIDKTMDVYRKVIDSNH